MILVDTSVWIDHFALEIPRLTEILLEGTVVTHAFVEGEIACGSLRRRADINRFLRRLPRAPDVPHGAVRFLLESERLYGRGVGWVDLHLVASAQASGCKLWTHDKRLERIASQLGLAA